MFPNICRTLKHRRLKTDATGLNIIRTATREIKKCLRHCTQHQVLCQNFASASTTPEFSAKSESQNSFHTLREDILTDALVQVPQKGWSTDAIAVVLPTYGLSTIAHGLFPNGGFDLVAHFMTLVSL